MRVRTAVLLAFASLTLIGASRPLNPLVPRVPNENAVRLAECAEGAAPAPMPRIEVADLPDLPEPPITAPPSSGLRTQLRDAQTAVTRDDHSSFEAALARARNTLSDYPAGGEKNAAQNVVRVYEDIAVLWDAQFTSPFFGEESAAYRAASAYPGWSEAIRRQILVDDRDRRFYPARESRQFLAGVAATRLERLGVRTPAVATPRVAEREEEPDAALPSVRPRRKPGKVETHASAEPRRSTTGGSTRRATSSSSGSSAGASRSTTARSTASPSRATSSPSTTPSRATTPSSSPAPARATTPAPAPPPVRSTTPSPAPRVNEPAPPITQPAAPVDTPTDSVPTQSVPTQSAPTDSAPTETSPLGDDPASATDPAATDTATAGTTDSAATTAVATDTTATTEPDPPARKRNLVIPLLLILVGIGVLIVLFRSSS